MDQDEQAHKWPKRNAMQASAFVAMPRRTVGAGSASTRPRILHVSADFPDLFDARKTPVIQTLLDLTEERFDHHVISLNRRSPRPFKFGRSLLAGGGKPEVSLQKREFGYGEAIAYEAPPLGLFHATMLNQLGDRLGENMVRKHDLVIGHKLTIEGLVVSRISKQAGIPFGICIQGDTDTKIVQARPDLAPEFGRIFHEAEIVFPFTPWALRQVEARLGVRKGPTMLLPCPTDLDVPLHPQPRGDGLLSAFHLKNHQRKNLRGMVAAMRMLRDDLPVSLAIVGGGTVQDEAHCRRIAGDLDTIVFEGPLDRSSIRQRMNGATGFVLPSLRESFGLVFIEALFAGLPVVYPEGTSIDGYFDGAPFAIAIDAKSPSAIAGAMRRLVREEQGLKAQLREWQQSARAEQFMRSKIAQTFTKGLTCALHA